jgi:hypothetical protein
MDDVGAGLTGDSPIDPRFPLNDDSTSPDPSPSTGLISNHDAPNIPTRAGAPAAGPHPAANSTAAIYTVNHEKWRVPTVLAATIAVALGAALAAFLAWTAWQRARKRRRRLLVVRAQLERNQRELLQMQQAREP